MKPANNITTNAFLLHYPPEHQISLCMIVKNEEQFLPRCLDSVRALADEIIIVDTGSTDRTIEIAEACGARVYHHPWENDYSKHRNQSLSYATKGWIFMMDADEVIAERDVPKIKPLIKSVKADGFFFSLRNYEINLNLANITLNPNDYDEGNGFPGYIAEELIRLFRNEPDIRFTEQVHETVTQSFQRSNRILYNSGIPIHHYGKTRKDRIRQKQELYLKLGEDRLNNNPYDLLSYKGLSDQYLELDMPSDALTVSDKGLALYPEVTDLRFNRGLALNRLGRLDEARNEYAWVLARTPDHLGACHNLAHIYYVEHQYEKSVDILNRGIRAGLGHPALFLLLGQTYDALGKLERALETFDSLLRIRNDYPNVHYYKATLLMRTQRYDAAVHALEREIEIGGNVVAAYNLLGEICLTFNDRESAKRFFRTVLSIIPGDATAQKHLERIESD